MHDDTNRVEVDLLQVDLFVYNRRYDQYQNLVDLIVDKIILLLIRIDNELIRYNEELFHF
jgi:hypothetical protein